jgi:hypothetical protein
MKNKYWGKFSDSTILLHNITHTCDPHSSGPIECHVIGGASTWNPDLLPCDFDVFGPVKKPSLID